MSEGPYSPLWGHADWVEMFVKCIVGRLGGTRFQQWRISGSSRCFTALVQIFRSRGKRAKINCSSLTR